MAEIKQEFVVARPRKTVWATFKDLETVAGCLPGAALTDPPREDHVKGRMTVKLGPIKADFHGEADIERNEDDFAGTIKGLGLDKNQGSRAKGTVRYVLEEADNGAATRVVVSVTYTLSGALAQFSRGGVVEAVAARLTKDFSANLEAELAARDPAASGANASHTDAAQAPTAAERPQGANELNALSLIAAVVRDWFRKLFARA